MSSEVAPGESITTTQSTPAPAEVAVELKAVEAPTDASDAQPSPAQDVTAPIEESVTVAAPKESVLVAAPKESVPVADSKESVPVAAPKEPEVTPEVEAKSSAIAEKDGQAVALANTPISKLSKELPSIIEEADYKEMWGITLIDESHVPTSIVLEKFLRANDKDVVKAKAQLIDALKWRKTMNPLQILSDVEFDRAKFGNLGYVTSYKRADGQGKEIITWNIYGGVKELKATFGDVKE
jgi:phosphatidylinositol transfer protein SFH5